MNEIVSDQNPAVLAARFVNYTHKNVFLTGKAGTGKTTFLRNIVHQTHKRCVIAAPTGIAAINAGGVTLHSLFQLPFGNFIPENNPSFPLSGQNKISTPLSLLKNLRMSDAKRTLLRQMELLIIDEVSMLRADVLDAMDLVMRHVRKNRQSPFGGVQVLFIGDLLQLPPVVRDEEWEILKPYYNSLYFFDARVLRNNKPAYIELEKIYRQDDARFISLLNNLRNNSIVREDIDLLNSFYQPGFKSPENYVTLTTHNYKAGEMNTRFLRELPGRSFFYKAEIKGEFNESAHPLEETLELKKGARVMFVKNDPSGAQRFFNGKIGVVSGLSDTMIEVGFDDGGIPVLVEKHQWENIKFEVDPGTNEIQEKIIGTFSHYPIKLAWAITVHKSQGLTFDKAILDVAGAFAPGQVYVALSRLRSLKGLVLTSSINYDSITQDSKVQMFAHTKTEQENLSSQLEKEAALFLKNYLSGSFDFNPLAYKLSGHAESYTKDQARSGKQKYHSWALGLKQAFVEIKPFADKFRRQVIQISESKDPDYLKILDKRISAAKDYFTPFFKAFSDSIFKHIETVCREKKVKSYLNELLEIESELYEQLKRIKKSAVFIKAVVENRDWDAETIKKLIEDASREEQIRKSFQVLPEKGKRKPKLQGEKIIKPDTKEETFKLFQQGKGIEEIAATRGLTTGTIESHLAFQIANGKLKATQLMSPEKIRNILTVSKTLNTTQFISIKQALSDDYTYGEIRIAMASVEKGEEKG